MLGMQEVAISLGAHALFRALVWHDSPTSKDHASLLYMKSFCITDYGQWQHQ